ncbi:cadmium-translocating P-type ATPase [Pseudonocardia sp. KRD-169]|uniref:Cadmium-translocating P-type ATPase n=2 Tax=Pseudonocardia abyssalis TaxID=2792008 RepID=A0ABS6UNI1_9PSEU|nr:cadmium-translocating P-type ATPase [Pseudonocardia abyssalis]MBW0133794.1 cadmium-translocating P-type ATPase [Pseudonocardia abyssalis]
MEAAMRFGGGRTLVEGGLLLATFGGLLAGLVATAAGRPAVAAACWAAGTVVALVPSVGWVVVALRRGRAGVDLLAVLSLVGTLVVGEYLAGALIAVMVATGRTLEGAAERRASKDLRALLEHAPRSARRRVGDVLETVALDAVRPGDLLVVGPGEVVPVDGRVADVAAALDESVLTGESRLVERAVGEAVRSGVVNAGAAFGLRAEATADDSTYAGIVRLAQEAGADTAPVVRLADRYAAWFLPLSLAVAGAAWLVSGSAVRAVAVLVVATPCPLLLAAPVAIVSGLSRASRRGVVVRSGGALENLGRARTLMLDKTGTLTAGRPVVVEVAAAPAWRPDDVLAVAASADQLSPHVLARAVLAAARRRGLPLSMPVDVTERPGRGVSAHVDGRAVEVGKRPGPAPEEGWARTALGRAVLDGTAVSWVTVDGQVVGAVLLRDPLRRDAPRTLRRLRAAGFRRLVLLTGDRAEPAREIGTVLGLDEVRAGQSPADKVAAVRAERERDVTVMVGDGVNDAPALAAATVGVAMGARGASASSEAADVVLTVDRLDHLADAMEIARRARRIAVQSAAVGMGLSLVAMAFAAAGLLPPAAGALLQEGIDVAVILNALRALRPGRDETPPLTPRTEELLHRFSAEHDTLSAVLPLLRDAASRLAIGPSGDALDAVRRAHTALVEDILPHERAEETELYPALAAPLGGPEATATMSRTHAEIERLTARLGVHLALAGDAPLPEDRVEDVLATLYGLDTILRLHFAQEEESYFTLAAPGTSRSTRTGDADLRRPAHRRYRP